MENQQQTTALCRAGCGFFGSPSTEGLCSKCYKDYVKRKQDTARVAPATMPAVVNSSGPNTASTAPNTVSSTCSADHTAATTSTLMIAEKLREVSCSQAAKSSEDMTAQLESVAAAVEAAGGITASSSSTSSGALSTSRKRKVDSKNASTVKVHSGIEEKGVYKSTTDGHNSNDTVFHEFDIKCSVASLDAATNPETASNNEGQPAPKKANRCHVCKKRVGLTGFVCRCGGLYCGEHRYDTAHGCSFDYKTMEREEIRKNNPVIVSEKIQRI